MKPQTLNDFNLPMWVKQINPSAIEKLLKYGSKSDFISFALGLPESEFSPKNTIKQVINEMIDTEENVFQYTPPLEELKSQIVKLMALRGVACNEKQIFLTSGAQQGINLLVRLLLEPGRQVILEELVYPGILQTLDPFSPQILTISTDPKSGVNVDKIEALLKSGIKPAFMYIVADGSNPQAVNLALDKRVRLAELANIYGMLIIEDDPYGFLNYQNKLPCLKSYGGDKVLYVGSFSKIFSPSLRTGWLVVPECLLPLLGSLKEATDINIATFGQRIVNGLLKKGIFETHLEMLCAEYLKRRNQMVSALNRYFPSGINFHIPDNGLYIWVDFLKKINTSALLEIALKSANVAFLPSQAFSATAAIQITNGMRLNFTHSDERKIHEGIKRLSEIVKHFQQDQKYN
jgi:2-aminoadipate transaminase